MAEAKTVKRLIQEVGVPEYAMMLMDEIVKGTHAVECIVST